MTRDQGTGYDTDKLLNIAKETVNLPNDFNCHARL